MANDDPTILPVRQSLVDLLEAAEGMQPNLLPDPGHLDGPIPNPPKLNDWRGSYGPHELKGDEPSPEENQKESQKKTDEENKKLKEESSRGRIATSTASTACASTPRGPKTSPMGSRKTRSTKPSRETRKGPPHSRPHTSPRKSSRQVPNRPFTTPRRRLPPYGPRP